MLRHDFKFGFHQYVFWIMPNIDDIWQTSIPYLISHDTVDEVKYTKDKKVFYHLETENAWIDEKELLATKEQAIEALTIIIKKRIDSNKLETEQLQDILNNLD